MKSTATTIHLAGNTLILSLTDTPRQEVADLQAVVERGKQLSVEVKQYRQKRSLDANSFCWVVCQKIAEVIRSTKEEVYRREIRDVGQCEIVPIRDDAVDTWIERWGGRGIGWFAEVMDDSKLEGYKKVISYYGSSVYDTREMSILIDEIVSQAKELNIETLPPDEVESLKALWGKEG